MRKLGVRALAALFCAALTVSVAVADDTDDGKTPPANKGSWWPGGWFGSQTKPEEKKPTAKAEPADEGPSLADRAAEARLREQKAYLRRLEACDRLQEIAIETNDAALQRQVEQLTQQVFEVYKQRTASPVSGSRFEAADGFTEMPAPKKKAEKVKPAKTAEDKP